MVAKRFFYVSAGILCLAAAYHLGARSAGAQGGLIQAGEVSYIYGTQVACVVGRTIYRAGGIDSAPGPGLTVNSSTPPVPGSAQIISVDGDGPAALLENGDVWKYESGNGGWTLKATC